MNLDKLLSGRLLATNAIWSILGNGFPLLVGIWAIPKLIHQIGTERFGLLTVIWVGVGYFSLFDLGLGRALTKLTAQFLANGRQAELPALIATGQRLMLGLGLLAAGGVLACAAMLVDHVLHVSAALTEDAVHSFWVLAAGVPFVVLTAGLIGVLQAYQMTARISAVRIPLGVLNFIAPVIVANYTTSLTAITAVLACLRIGAWIAYMRLAMPFLGTAQESRKFERGLVSELLGFGAWITISNIISPVLVYCDRFVIGAVLSMEVVAYYTTPYEVINRFLNVPGAIFDVLFAALASGLVAEGERTRAIFAGATKMLLAFIFCSMTFAVLFAHKALNLWLGPVFAEKSTLVSQLLAIGVFVNFMGRFSFAALQAGGYPNVTARLHLIELPLYVVALWTLIKLFGITGAAFAWAGRMVFDATALFIMGSIKFPVLRHEMVRTAAMTAIGALLLIAFLWPQSLEMKIAIATIATAASAWLGLREVPKFLNLQWMEKNNGRLA